MLLIYPRDIHFILTLKAPITTAADNNKYIFIGFSEKIRIDVSSESSARQRIQIKNQAFFSSKDKSNKLKCCLPQFLFGTLRVNVCESGWRISWCLFRYANGKNGDAVRDFGVHICHDLFVFHILNQLLQLCTARTAWSDSVIRSETSLITESDRCDPIR